MVRRAGLDGGHVDVDVSLTMALSLASPHMNVKISELQIQAASVLNVRSIQTTQSVMSIRRTPAPAVSCCWARR